MGYAAPHHAFEASFATPVPAPAALRLRPAGPGDAAAISAHFLRLSPEDRALRFCGAPCEATLARHAREVAEGAPAGVAAVETDAGTGAERVRGLAEVFVTDGTAELAVSLEPAWRGRGLAARLVRAAARMARELGARRLIALTLPGNGPMLGLGRKLGGRARRGPDGLELVFDLDALAPGPAAAAA